MADHRQTPLLLLETCRRVQNDHIYSGVSQVLLAHLLVASGHSTSEAVAGLMPLVVLPQVQSCGTPLCFTPTPRPQLPSCPRQPEPGLLLTRTCLQHQLLCFVTLAWPDLSVSRACFLLVQLNVYSAVFQSLH